MLKFATQPYFLSWILPPFPPQAGPDPLPGSKQGRTQVQKKVQTSFFEVFQSCIFVSKEERCFLIEYQMKYELEREKPVCVVSHWSKTYHWLPPLSFSFIRSVFSVFGADKCDVLLQSLTPYALTSISTAAKSLPAVKITEFSNFVQT